MKPIIEIEQLGKRYDLGLVGAASLKNTLKRRFGKSTDEDDRFWALKDINLTVQPGEILGLIGHNGAGKSTLLKILSRITEPTNGRAVLRGKLASLLEVGTGFHPELSGRDNIFLNGTILGMSRKEVEKKYDSIVEFAETERFMETPVKRYSSGMRVRLAFSVAAHLDPDIMLIDEVLAVGDARFQARCLGKMDEVANAGRTIVFVSHQMHLIQNLCTRCIEMEQGRIVANGKTATIVEDYYRRQTKLAEGESFEYAGETTGAVTLRHAELRNRAQEAQHQFNVEEPFDLFFLWELTEVVPALRVSFRVRNEMGQIIFASSTHDQNLSLERTGSIPLSASVNPNLLLPGKYSVDIVARPTNGPMLVDLPQTLSFTILQNMHDPERPMIAAGRKGLVYCPPDWSIQPPS